jgi:lantibiotic modifying enzyme
MESVASIARDLDQDSASEATRTPNQLAEHAMLEAYLGFAELGESHFERSVQLLENAMDGVSQTPMRPALFNGFTGVAWILEHLQSHPLNTGFDEAEEDFDANQQVDAALSQCLSTPTWSESYDLINGLVGIGIFAADRLPRQGARDCLERIVDHLARLARPMDVGVTWWTPAEQMLPETRAQYPQGHANLGVAHGVPAVIAFLAQVKASGIATEKASTLLAGSLCWLVAEKMSRSSGSLYGYNYSRTASTVPARSAWCYGDPGIAAALWCASRWTSDPALEKEALEAAHCALRRDPKKGGVVDVPLCHGAAGLGHLFNRMYQGAGDPAFLEAARMWFARALEMRRVGEGFGGYVSFQPGRGGWIADRGFLSGSIGIALALLGASTPVEPGWDRLLLASIPPMDF